VRAKPSEGEWKVRLRVRNGGFGLTVGFLVTKEPRLRRGCTGAPPLPLTPPTHSARRLKHLIGAQESARHTLYLPLTIHGVSRTKACGPQDKGWVEVFNRSEEATTTDWESGCADGNHTGEGFDWKIGRRGQGGRRTAIEGYHAPVAMQALRAVAGGMPKWDNVTWTPTFLDVWLFGVFWRF